jgi:hypothetical protein
VRSDQMQQVFARLEKNDMADSKVMFEIYHYVYTIAHLLLQNLNIYKTV